MPDTNSDTCLGAPTRRDFLKASAAAEDTVS